MSSEEGGPTGVKMKRRRLHGACDLCRQKKIRCDSAKMPGNKCSHCVAFGSECTHVHVNQKIGQGYRSSRDGLSSAAETLSLAQLRESMDPLLKTILFPTYQAPTNPAIIRETIVNLARYARALEAAVPASAMADKTSIPPMPKSPSPSASTYSRSSTSTESPKPLSECVPNSEVEALADNMKRTLVLTGSKERFFGPSSSISLLQTAIELGGQDTNIECKPSLQDMKLATRMRPEFWSVHPWEQPPPPDNKPYDFPEPGLRDDLVELFFSNVDYYLPLLHRPTFEKGIKAGLHLTDAGFGMTLLGVCALASRFSDDERVLLEGTKSFHSCGYKWFRQMELFHESSLKAPSLYELQAFCLAVMYLHGSSTPEKSWFLVGLGIRAALDVGLNQQSKDTKPTVDGELRKRVFYALLLAESVISAAAGRSPSVSTSDFNTELPVDCDDEYWENEDPDLAFKQPIGKPSKVAYFNCFIELMMIHASAQRSFYSVKRPDPPPGVSPEEWDRTTLAGLDSALNEWVDSVPDHLRWDPHQTNSVFFDQSAMLFVTFYHTQILVHRPFIVSVDRPSLAFSSLAICTNAARACSRIMETQSKKGLIPAPQVQIAIFVSGLVLLLSIWRGRRTGFALMDEEKELAAVRSCIDVLETYESRWHLAGRFRDILMSMVGAIAFLPPMTKFASKRSRQILEAEESDLDLDLKESTEPTVPRLATLETPIRPLPTSSAGSLRGRRRVTGTNKLSVMPAPTTAAAPPLRPIMNTDQDQQRQQQQQPPQTEQKVPFEFPLYSSDLSKPFFQFDPGEEASASQQSLQQQLDDLEEILGQGNLRFGDGGDGARARTDGGGGRTSSQMFSFGGHSGAVGTSLSDPGGTISAFGNGTAAIGAGATHQLPNSSFEQNFLNNNILDLQGTSMWTGVPSGTDWGDWNTYITNIEALNQLQGPPFASDSRSMAGPTREQGVGLGAGGRQDELRYNW